MPEQRAEGWGSGQRRAGKFKRQGGGHGRRAGAHHRPPADSQCSGRAISARCPWAAPPAGRRGRQSRGRPPQCGSAAAPPTAAGLLAATIPPTSRAAHAAAVLGPRRAPRRPSPPREARAWPSRRRPRGHPPPCRLDDRSASPPLTPLRPAPAPSAPAPSAPTATDRQRRLGGGQRATEQLQKPRAPDGAAV